jgi:GDP-L-fucose synthase
MAAACVHVMELDETIYRAHTSPMLSHINVGTGVDCSIRELAETIARVTGFRGRLVFDASKPDGTPRKLLDVSRLKGLGWTAQIGLEAGLRDACAWYVQNIATSRN